MTSQIRQHPRRSLQHNQRHQVDAESEHRRANMLISAAHTPFHITIDRVFVQQAPVQLCRGKYLKYVFCLVK